LKFASILLLIILATTSAITQESPSPSPKFVFLPPGLNVSPLRANLQEPRVGVFKFLSTSEMKVDIGNSIDIFGLRWSNGKTVATVGIDFMAYAYVIGANGFRLQIDAVDGFFGGNLSITHRAEVDNMQIRLRILHQSAHFVDGHIDPATNSWANGRAPIPYTRDFGELTGAHTVSTSFGRMRYYVGISYATLVRPTEVQRVGYFAGNELVFDRIIGILLDQPTNLYVAYHLSYTGSPSYLASHHLQAGIKFGEWRGKGPTMYLSYYRGRHFAAEYLDVRQETIAAGFTVDFF
jgi:hypothetical protein